MNQTNQPDPKVEQVDVAIPAPEAETLWQPIVGKETWGLLEHIEDLTGEGKACLRDEAAAVLQQGLPPSVSATTQIGLVVGHVQSGKTASFTVVAALAKDNGFAVVILITGTSIPLSTQSVDRLKRDLRLETRSDRSWQHFHNPRRSQSLSTIQGIIADWRDPAVPETERQTILITVMKHHGHLRYLSDLLRSLNLLGLSILVIDDEADQAGLNNMVTQGAESTTYRRLVELRNLLPRHTYLQYTATPQAPLLINLIDVLSPKFAKVLTPGQNYIGGREFFIERGDLVRIIPPGEIPTRDSPLHDPPPTLLEAIRVFVLGVAAGIQIEGGRGNRSMMVHPSQQTMQHAEYTRWVRETKLQWENLLSLPDTDPDRRDFIDELRHSYEDLQRTVSDLPDFDSLLTVLRRQIRRIHITEVNAASGPTPQINWSSAYAHILVGGQAMDRGFTVEGLTVTYMPRGLGVGNADTVWQRARFLGYKNPYLGFCRIYLEVGVRDAYIHYVEHEEDIRERLVEHGESGRDLSEWKRAFFLDTALQPTRRNVLGLDYMQSVISDSWYAPSAPHDSEEANEWNRGVVAQFLSEVTLIPAPGHPERTEPQRHQIAENVSLQSVFEKLLVRLRIARPRDSQPFTGLLLQIREYLDTHPYATCTVFRISPNVRRERTLNEYDEIPNLFQGAYPVEPPELRGSIYPGDRSVREPHGLTVQIHTLDIKAAGKQFVSVPVVAVWVPREMARSWLVQARA